MIGCTQSFDRVPFYSKRKEPFQGGEGHAGGIVLKVTSFCPKETTENMAGQRNRDDRGVCGPMQGKGTHGHRTRPPKHQKVKARQRII